MFRNFKTVERIVFGRGCFNQLDEILTRTVSLDGLPATFEEMLAGKIMGRVLVEL